MRGHFRYKTIFEPSCNKLKLFGELILDQGSQSRGLMIGKGSQDCKPWDRITDHKILLNL